MTTTDENSIMMDSYECEVIVNDNIADDVQCRQHTNNGSVPSGSVSGMLHYIFVHSFFFH